MSTRCQIAFYYNETDKEHVAMIYQHCDGYPEGVIPDLLDITNRFHKKRVFYDPEYLAARTLQFLMNKSDEELAKMYNDPTKMFVTGFGIDNEVHDDLDYFYQVYDKKIVIRDGGPEGAIIKEVAYSSL